jgi:very-short-patch-repair endonuclease
LVVDNQLADGERPDQVCWRIASAQFGVVSRPQAWATGLTRDGIHDRVQRGRWQRMLPGVYRLAGSPETWYQRLMAACLWAGDGTAASHRSAAALWALPDFTSDLIELSTPRDLRARGGWPLLHRVTDFGPADIVLVVGIPVTSPARTLLDLSGLASLLGRAIVEAALDDALRRGLTSLSRLRWTAGRVGGRGKPGTSLFKELLRQRSRGYIPPASELESQLVRGLREANLPPPRRQHEIRERGKLLARVDLAYPDSLLAIEADGYRYHSGRAAWQHDRTRRNALTSRGWRILHVTWDDLQARPQQIIDQIRRTLGAVSS